MRALEKNIRGFNLLELLVVIVIISIISAVAYPNFSSWKKEREARNAATKIKNMFTNINSQVQNGSFAFAQVQVTTEYEDTEETITGTKKIPLLVVISKGLNMDTFTQRLRSVANWNSDITVRCNPVQTGGWDAEGATIETSEDPDASTEFSVSNNLQVGFLSFDNIAVNFDGKTSGTICFSKDGTWYSASGEFEDGLIIEEFLICNGIPVTTNCSESANKNVYAINWSRFGNITLKKWNKDMGWVLQ